MANFPWARQIKSQSYLCVTLCRVRYQDHNTCARAFTESNMCDCVMCFECQLQGTFTAHYFPIGPGPELLRNSVLLTSQNLWLTRLRDSAEDKPGEIGIIVALAMLILGTFQWAVITSITVDGLVCSNTNTRRLRWRDFIFIQIPTKDPNSLIMWCT